MGRPAAPVTPVKRGTKRPATETPTTATPSSAKKARTPRTPGTPSQTALKRAEAEKKRQSKADWAKWVQESRWEKDPNYRQKPGTSEIHKTDARLYYSLTNEELDTLPYWEFENKYNPDQPGRSYPHEVVLMLVHRKFATLDGHHRQTLSETALLKKGKGLFDAHNKTRLEKQPNKPRRPQTFRIMTRSTFSSSLDILPRGAWLSPVWEDGKIIGEWMNLQFDPEDYGDDVYTPRVSYPTARFRPIGSDRWEEN